MPCKKFRQPNFFLQKAQKGHFSEIPATKSWFCTVCTVWKFANFCLTVFFCKVVKNFRENNVLRTLYNKMALGMAPFGIFGANLRKFDLFGLIEEHLDY